MLTYALEDRGGLPLYEYLYRRIRADILDGTLTAGERLPSKRALAEHLQVSVITVEGAYAQLAAEGYVSPSPRRGFFVAQAAMPLPAPGPAPEPRPPAPPGSWRLDLTEGQVDASKFPLATWTRLTRQVLSEEGPALLKPLPHQGLEVLREAIAADLRDYRGLSADPEQIVVGAGAEYLYLLLSQLFGREAVFGVEDPGYPKIAQVYRRAGARCVPVPLDGQGMDPLALQASGATVAHLSPSHHYPTGQVMPIARRQALLRWAAQGNRAVIEDDYDSEFRFSGRPIPSLQSIDTAGKTVYLNTFSQTIAPSMRMGFMVLPSSLLERYRTELGFYACTVPAVEQYVLAKFLRGGFYEQHLARMRKEYRTRRTRVLEAFRQSSFSSRIHIAEQGAGLHFLLRVDTDLSDEALRRRAAERGVRLRFLSDCAEVRTPACLHNLVVNYVGLDTDRLPEIMALLGEIL